MRDYLEGRIAPATKAFIDKLLLVEDEIKDRGRVLEVELKSVQNHKELLKSQQVQANDALRIKQEKFDKEIAIQREAGFNLANEVSRYTKLNTELIEKNKSIELLHEKIQDEETQINKELKKHQVLSKTYDDKIEMLQFDVEKIETHKKELDEFKRQLDIKERTLNNKEEKLVNKEIQLSERQLGINNAEKRAKLEFARETL